MSDAPRALAHGLDTPFCSATGGYTVCTDKEDYAPDSTVHISGAGFAASADLTLRVTLSDGSVVSGAGSLEPWPKDYDSFFTDAEGAFQFDYILEGISGSYVVEVMDAEGVVLATHTFTDGRTIISATLDGATSLAVVPNASITALVEVTTFNGGGSNDWESTAWQIANGPGSLVCVDTPNHLGNGTNSESFQINAPAATGIYNAYFRAYDTDSCGSSQPSNLFQLPSAVIVDDTPPVITATVSGTQGNNGWYTSAVTVSYTVTDTDNLSGIDEAASDYTDDVLGSEGIGQGASAIACDLAGNCASASVSGIKIDLTGPTALLSVTAGTPGANGWYTSDVTVATTGGDAISGPVACTADQIQTTETAGALFNGECTNDAGLSTAAATLPVKLDKSGPTALLTVTAGTPGDNGWYTSDVTVATTGGDAISGPVACTADQIQTTETAGALFNGECTNDAGLSTAAATLPVKLDKSGPTALLTVTAGTLGNNGWYTSDVTVATTGGDTISGPVACTAEQYQTSETMGTDFNGECTNDAGLSTAAATLPVKLDKSGPTALLTVTAGTPGDNGWYTSDVTVATTGGDAISGPVACTADQIQTTETAGALFNGECTNDAGLSTAAATLPVKLDKSGPTALLTVTAGTPGDNGWYTSDVTVATTGGDAISGPVACTAEQYQTGETMGTDFNGECTNDAGLSTAAATLPVKLDKSGPTALLTVTAGTLGNNGWYTSDVTVATTGGDTISGPVACTAEQYQTSETTGTDFNGECTNDAGLSTAAATLPVKLDKSGPTALLTVTAGTLGNNGWYTSDVTVATTGGDAISGPVACTADQIQTTETAGALFNGECTNDAGLSTAAATLPVKLDKSGPTALLTVTAGTLGNNGWYTSDVTVATTGGDTISGPVACTAEQYQTSETTGTDFNGECTNDAGLSTAAATLPVKLDKSGPTALLTVTAGTPGDNGWYTSDVTVATTGGDAISGPVACTADQIQTTETAGALFNGECTNDAGLSTAAATLPVKLDKSGPTALLTVTAGTLGNNGWYTSDVTVATTGGDTISGPVACTAEQYQTSETTGTDFNGERTNDAGLSTAAATLPVKLDKSGPTALLTVTAGTLGNNGWYTSDVTVATTGGDAISGPVACTADQIQTTETAGALFNGECTNDAGLSTAAATLPVKLDQTPPTITGSASPEANVNGWNNTNLSVTFACSDALSLIDACLGDTVLTDEGAGQTVEGTATDLAGNVTNTVVGPINIDKTAPMSAEIVFPTDGTIYYLDSEWSVGCDPSSGICGTATDDGDVTSGVDYVQISIQQVSTGLYWDGDGFDSFDEVEFVADGSADWLNGFAFANFTDDGEYIVRARATDGAGNKEATDVVSFTINAIDIDRTWVTGGGKIGKGKPDWTFGGVAGYLDYGVGGQYQITDHRDGTKPRHYNEISYFGVLDENTVVFYASVEGEIGGIIVEITDNGSGGGKNKMKDEIHVYNENYEWLYGGYLDGGNFTIHTE